MDRRLKERLVGATILLVLIVLIVPELLSGPHQPHRAPVAAGGPAEILRNVTVDLATNKASADDPAAASAPAQSAAPPEAAGRASSQNAAPGDAGRAAPGDGGDPAPGESEPAVQGAADSALAPVIATLKAQPPAPVLDQPRAPTASPSMTNPVTARAAAAPESHHTWVVQIDSFVSRANAELEARRLKPHERSVHVSQSGRGATLRYRVRVGPFDDRAAADQAMLRLRKEGLRPSLISP